MQEAETAELLRVLQVPGSSSRVAAPHDKDGLLEAMPLIIFALVKAAECDAKLKNLAHPTSKNTHELS